MPKETPILRVQVGTDSNNPTGNPTAPDYQYIRLRFDASRNGAASATAGRPVFDRVLIVTHIYPGTPDFLDCEVIRYVGDDGERLVVDPARAERFREFIAKFEADGEALSNGMPLALLNLDPAQEANLGGLGIQTVEGLAEVPDGVLNKLGMGGRILRDRAKAFMDASAGAAPLAALSARNEALEAEQASMKEELAELRNALRAAAAVGDAKPAKRGAV